jgi:hypothetical protein
VVDIEITKIGRSLHFPLIVKRSKDGGNQNVNECVIMRVDDIMLADLIKFQKIEFVIKRGYYWNGEKDYRIQSFIKHIFDMRNKYKREHNPLQLVYKLIMNSAYGKTIQKPIDNTCRFFDVYDAEQERIFNNYVNKNYQQLVEIVRVDGSKISKVITKTTSDKHFGLNLFGIHVLSMSKRIMNEVFECCEDLDAPVFYQDTDSLHVSDEHIPKISELFKQRYGRELIGSELGQFHSDFASNSGRSDVQYAQRSLFLAKKIYVDELLMSDGSVEYMSRMKGVSQSCIQIEAAAKNMTLWQLYEDMINGTIHTIGFEPGRSQLQDG